MGAPVQIRYLCEYCNMPNVMSYATLPRINEHLIEKVSDNGDVRVWRCRCTECGKSAIFNEFTTSDKPIEAVSGAREGVQEL